MCTIHEMYLRFAGMTDPVQKLGEIIKEKEYFLIKSNQEELLQGLDKTGKQLKQYRSKPYADFKHAMNATPGLFIPDLFLTGSWYNSLYAEVTKTDVTIKSDQEKDSLLVSKYGQDIKGVTTERKIAFGNTVVLPAFIDYIRTIAQL